MPGPFYFAWVDETENTFNDSHVRNDEQVLSFHMTQSEGDFASLELTIVNPRVGLLAPGRKLWAWFAYADPSKTSESESETEHVSEAPFADITPLLFGRLVGVPENVDSETITVTFIARPTNYEEQKAALAETLKVAPYWDAIWFAPEDVNNPDNVLESRPQLWHVDPVTHVLTVSDIVNGEDGTITFDESNVFYDSVRVTYGQAPLRQINIVASVTWPQMATGGLDISSAILGGAGQIVTYCGNKLVDNWPKPGASIGGGWKVGPLSECVRVDGVGTAAWDYGPGYRFGRTENMHDIIVPEWAVQQTVLFTTFPAHIFHMPRQRFTAKMSLDFDTSRNRGETIAFRVEADVQSVLTDPEGEDSFDMSFQSSEIITPDAITGIMPIGKISASRYFPTARGTQSIEYLIALARSQLIARARMVSIEVEVPFLYGIQAGLSLRKNGIFYDARLPGGVAAGKITSYSLSVDGDSGVQACDVTLACTVGRGGTVSAIPGSPTYAEDGYMENGYQFRSGQFVMPLAGIVAYETIEGGTLTNDDGVDFDALTPAKVIRQLTIVNDLAAQEAAMGVKQHEPNDVFAAVNSVPTTFSLELVPVTGGPFQNDFPIATTLLKIPKTIDLEAESSP